MVPLSDYHIAVLNAVDCAELLDICRSLRGRNPPANILRTCNEWIAQLTDELNRYYDKNNL